MNDVSAIFETYRLNIYDPMSYLGFTYAQIQFYQLS